MNNLFSRKNRLVIEKKYLQRDCLVWNSRLHTEVAEYAHFFKYLETKIPHSKNYNDDTFITSNYGMYYRFHGSSLVVEDCYLSLDAYDEAILLNLGSVGTFKIGAISMLTEDKVIYLRYLLNVSYYIVLNVNKGFYKEYDWILKDVEIHNDFLELEVTVIPY